MNIAIFGTGNMASGLATLFAKAGHTITIASRDQDKARTSLLNWATISRPAHSPLPLRLPRPWFWPCRMKRRPMSSTPPVAWPARPSSTSPIR